MASVDITVLDCRVILATFAAAHVRLRHGQRGHHRDIVRIAEEIKHIVNGYWPPRSVDIYKFRKSAPHVHVL